MGPTESPRHSKAARGTLRAFRREFVRCSNHYRPLYHKICLPHCKIPDRCEEFDNIDVNYSYRNSFAQKLDDGWEECELYEVDSYFRIYFGSGDGLNEFRVLAEGIHWVLGEIDFRPASLGRSSSASFVSELLPVQEDVGYDNWLTLLYRLGLEYPSPLLWCKHSILSFGEYGDAPCQAQQDLEGGEQYPKFPYHVRIAQPLFTASIAAIDIILDSSTTVLLGVTPTEEALSDASETVDQSEKGVLPPVLEFRFDGVVWRLKFDTGHGIEDQPFEDMEGFLEMQKLLSQPHRSMTPFKLQDMVFNSGPLLKVEDIDEHFGLAEKDEGVGQEKADDMAIDNVEREIASTKKQLTSCVNPGLRRDLEDHLKRLEQYHRQVVGRPQGKKRKRVKREWRSDYGAALNLVGVRISRARRAIRKKMPEFGEYLRRVRQQGGFFVFLR